jgi:predicted nucleic acid-binding Zn ribbon protein
LTNPASSMVRNGNTKHQIRNTKHETPNTKHQTPNTKHKNTFQIVGRMTRPGRKKRSFVHIGNVIRDVLKNHRLETDTSLIRVWDIWEEAVGEVIAANTRPAAFKGNLLIVNATSSSWLQQLRFLKPEIIQKLNHVLGEVPVKDIKFKIGPVD